MLAPYSTGDSMLLDAKTLVQSESGSYMKAFAELPSVIPQSGGSRSRSRSRKHRRSRRRQSRRNQRGGLQEFNGSNGAFGTPMGVGMSGTQNGGRRRRQYGGQAPFDSAFARPVSGPGQNPQFQTEAGMGYGYNEFKGPQ